MLGTVTLQRIPPVAARRHPLRRVITQPRPTADINVLSFGPRGLHHAAREPGIMREYVPPLRPLDDGLVACHYAEQFLETQAA